MVTLGWLMPFVSILNKKKGRLVESRCFKYPVRAGFNREKVFFVCIP